MKGFIIALAVIVALGVAVMTQYETLGEKILAKLDAEAGSVEKLHELSNTDPKKMVELHAPLMKRRWQLAYVGLLLNNEAFFMKVGRSSVAFYADTEMQTDPNYGKQLFELAKISEQMFKPPQEAFNLYKKYIELFPTAKNVQVAMNAVNNMKISYGMQ